MQRQKSANKLFAHIEKRKKIVCKLTRLCMYVPLRKFPIGIRIGKIPIGKIPIGSLSEILIGIFPI